LNPDQELIDGCRERSPKHQKDLFARYYSFAMSVCLRYAFHREEALEMVNDAFMKVFEHIDRYDSERPFKAWFRRILVNTALDHYRAARRYHTHMLTDQDVPETEYQATQELQLNAEDIIRLFDQLPPMQRLVFNLFEVEGYSHDEIGGLLDISPGTSRSNLTRARQRLQYLYINQFGGRS